MIERFPKSSLVPFVSAIAALVFGACTLQLPAHADGAAAAADDSASAIARKFSDAAPGSPSAPAPRSLDDLAAEREAEARQLSERLRRAREERLREAGRDYHPADPSPLAAPVRVWPAAPDLSRPPDTRVTILMILQVSNKGMRQWSKTADPMLCLHESCYLSRGPHVAAEKITRSQAFGPSVALGRRGLACRSKPACIFRDIDMETLEAKLQPVDLKILRHDRRASLAIHPDGTCSILNGRLHCLDTVEGPDWHAWIVPEAVAKAAGVPALEQALAANLGRSDMAGK